MSHAKGDDRKPGGIRPGRTGRAGPIARIRRLRSIVRSAGMGVKPGSAAGRGPAAACGVTGFKPTYQAIDADGVLPLSPSVDHIGPMARSVGDAAILFDILRDRSHSCDAPMQRGNIDGVRIGYLAAFHRTDCYPAISAGIDHAVACLDRHATSVCGRMGREVPPDGRGWGG